MPSDQSTHIFKNIFLVLKIFGIWGGRVPSKYYKYYSIVYLFVTFFCYTILLTINLIYTPRKLELMLREVVFYFTDIVVAAKIFTIIFKRDKIIEVLDIIDSDEFLGDYESKGLLYKVHMKYKFCWMIYMVMSNITFSSQFVPIVLNLIRGIETELPICNYYFLTDELRQSYYTFWFMYQSFGMYGHMMYNVSVDSFIAGLLIIAITQLKLLNANLCNFKMSEEESKLSKEMQDKISIDRLNSYLRHYDTILKYNKEVQDVLSTVIFFQFGVASIIICAVLCGLTILETSTEVSIFLVMYLFVMSSQIFVPGYLGTQLAYESEEIIFAAYSSEWIPRSQPFKRSLRILMNRAKTPLVITGLKMFSLSLDTFTSIMKTAYSFFTLIRNIQED